MFGKAVIASVSVALVMVGAGASREAHAGSASSVPPLTPPPVETPAPAPTPVPAPSATPTPAPAPRSTAALDQQVAALAAGAGASVGVALVELGGTQRISWSYQGDNSFVAASTYKLPLLMDQAQLMAAGSIHTTDTLAYTDADYEDGYFEDYGAGETFSRQDLAARVGQQSDNTAAHILVDSIGGPGALNAYASAHGATESAFYDPNYTTANDLSRLWVNEATGKAGGTAAQQWLYPLLTRTAYESGIPAGAPAGATVVHKIGIFDGEVNDAALVQGGPRGSYVLVVMTSGAGGDAGWSLIAAISRTVTAFEAARQ